MDYAAIYKNDVAVAEEYESYLDLQPQYVMSFDLWLLKNYPDYPFKEAKC